MRLQYLARMGAAQSSMWDISIPVRCPESSVGVGEGGGGDCRAVWVAYRGEQEGKQRLVTAPVHRSEENRIIEQIDGLMRLVCAIRPWNIGTWEGAGHDTPSSCTAGHLDTPPWMGWLGRNDDDLLRSNQAALHATAILAQRGGQRRLREDAVAESPWCHACHGGRAHRLFLQGRPGLSLSLSLFPSPSVLVLPNSERQQDLRPAAAGRARLFDFCPN